MTSWRNIPLVIGASYRVVTDIVSVHDSLRAGQAVEFVAVDYSRYDNLTALTFREHETGCVLQLWWLDKDADMDWRAFKSIA